MLSVLPLHHSFEFTTGLLLPLSRGAQVIYLAEVNGENVSRALKKGQVTCIVGVPALWDTLKRRILGKFQERSPRLEDFVNALIDANYLLRDATPLNFGPLLFFPVHMAFGGRIRYLISGGSALQRIDAQDVPRPWASTSTRATASPRPRRCSRSPAPMGRLSRGASASLFPGSRSESTSPTARASGRCSPADRT